MRFVCSLLAALAAGVAPAPTVTSAEFAAKAWPVAPTEQRYAFVQRLSEWQDIPRRDPAARPSAGEMALPAEGWKLAVRADAGPLLKRVAEDFRDYLERSMSVRVTLESQASLAGWGGARQAVVAGTREQLPDCGAALKGPKDYRLMARRSASWCAATTSAASCTASTTWKRA